VDPLLAELIRTGEMQNVTTEDYYQYMGQIYYLVKDEETQNILRNDPKMAVLMPALSHLVRTSNFTDKTMIKAMMIRWRRACRLQLMVNQSPNLASQARFDTWVNFGFAAIMDAVDGWRGRLVTERIKTYKIESSGGKSKGILARLFGQ
jgi:hypothetical protein